MKHSRCYFKYLLYSWIECTETCASQIQILKRQCCLICIDDIWHWMCLSGLLSTLHWTWETWWVSFQFEQKSAVRIIIFLMMMLINQVGLYDQCVTVRLADGRIVAQNIYPGETHCKYDHDLYITRSLGTCLIWPWCDASDMWHVMLVTSQMIQSDTKVNTFLNFYQCFRKHIGKFS